MCVSSKLPHATYARCKEFIADLTGHSISTGSLSNFQKSCVNHLQNYQQEITKQLLQSPVLHADETGIRLNGKISWMYVISTKTISYFAHHLNRGRQAMDDIGLLQLYKGTLIYDRFSSYFGYNCDHSLCNAHILRDLRMIKVKQRVSGCFRAQTHVTYFTCIRGYITTIKKK